VDRLSASDLSGGDELHLGWRPATAAHAEDLGLTSGMRVLDVGSGIGGPARYLVETLACQVEGVDLSPEFVAVASALTRRMGLSDRASFREASVLALPFEDAAFDAATMIHVGMNLPEKAGAFAEVRRVLKPGARFGVYDIMRGGAAELPFPMPWATTAETSFVESPDTYRRLLSDAGFTVESETDRRDFVLRLAREMRAKAEKEGPPRLGPQVLMGETARERLGNVMAALERGTITPVEMIARAV
jgi:ubiquinone/menaquinone biosynthesis C-methylase UbiE